MKQLWPAGFLGLLWSAACYWYISVGQEVSEPYLDEYFHVRQALAYWSHKWGVWDPKITTPPGLYLWSYAWLHAGRLLQYVSPKDLEGLDQLRFHNVISLLLVFVVVSLLLALPVDGRSRTSLNAAHLAFNTCLFPPLFFFCALYYTDILSTLVVLKCHHSFYSGSPLGVLVFGLLSLALRQTNIFWTAVYLGGLRVIQQCKNAKVSAEIPNNITFFDVIRSSWQHGHLYDPAVNETGIEGYLKTLLSLGVSALARLPHLIAALLPYLSLLATFSTFIIWNGGVVLGDKGNHVASLHLPQMLYIWPYIAFFSYPVIIPSLLAALSTYVAKPFLQRFHSVQSRPPRLSKVIFLISILVITTGVIHYNTIIHPFTLADNRHYTFYVFRLLRRHPLVKYLAAPLYILFAWMCILALGEPISEKKVGMAQHSDGTKARTGSEESAESPRVSFVLLWLATCTLSLATAPLVEPRYFILPWLVWRLHIPQERPLSSRSPEASKTSWVDSAVLNLQRYSLWLETVWFLAVNVGTAYMFLRRGFEWPSEPGAVQRFMW